VFCFQITQVSIPFPTILPFFMLNLLLHEYLFIHKDFKVIVVEFLSFIPFISKSFFLTTHN